MKLQMLVLWIVQVLSIVTILYCSWLLLERPTFALVAAAVVLAASLYGEYRLTYADPVDTP